MAVKNAVAKNWVLTAYAGRYYSDNQSPAGPGEALVEWDAVTALGVTLAGYRVYYTQVDPTTTLVFDQVIGSGINAGNNLSYLVTGLAAGTWYFAVTAYDTDGYETEYSTVVSKVVT